MHAVTLNFSLILKYFSKLIFQGNKYVYDNFVLVYGKIFVLLAREQNELICSYNIEVSPNTNYLPNSITVHRKKHTNTMYSINALNEVIRLHNNGVMDSKFEVDWEQYRNSLLVTSDTGLRRINTEIFLIHTV